MLPWWWQWCLRTWHPTWIVCLSSGVTLHVWNKKVCFKHSYNVTVHTYVPQVVPWWSMQSEPEFERTWKSSLLVFHCDKSYVTCTLDHILGQKFKTDTANMFLLYRCTAHQWNVANWPNQIAAKLYRLAKLLLLYQKASQMCMLWFTMSNSLVTEVHCILCTL